VGNLSGYIDLSGKVVIEPKYDIAGEFRESHAVVRQGDKYALIDPAGNPIAEIPYRVLGYFGYLDKSGNLALKNEYYSAADFDHDLAFVRTKGGIAYIDTKGAVVWRSR
jgi:hypothetical protein